MISELEVIEKFLDSYQWLVVEWKKSPEGMWTIIHNHSYWTTHATHPSLQITSGEIVISAGLTGQYPYVLREFRHSLGDPECLKKLGVTLREL